MVTVIIAVLMHILVFFLMKYCTDEPTTWDEMTNSMHLSTPTIYDVDIDSYANIYAYRQAVDSYVSDVVCTANRYFAMRNRIESNSSSDKEYTSIFLIIASAVFACVVANRLFDGIVYPVAVLLACVAGDYIASIIYKNHFALSKLDSDIERKISHFNEFYSPENYSYKISKEKALNHELLSDHMYYLSIVENSVVRRQSLYYIAEVAALVLYGIFILPNFNP